MLAILTMALTSCGDEDVYDEESPKALIGTWRTNFVYEDGIQGWVEFQFNSNGTFVYREWDEEENTIFREKGQYNVLLNNLTLKWDDGSEDTFIYTFNGKKLMLVYIEGDNFDVGLALTMTKQ